MFTELANCGYFLIYVLHMDVPTCFYSDFITDMNKYK